ncbi:MAG: phenylacetate-CoA oxygenase subunit PaaJ [Bacteroidetes bacterium]|nr:MAG: phenylacetate-CoA oxygenase subunit PaaJ [Bacteroidota bacterium]
MYTKADIQELLKSVMDPEIPFISVVQLGIIDDIRIEGKRVEIDMVPTFAGCPAIDLMKMQIEKVCREAGIEEVEVLVKQKAWSTNRISKSGRKALKDFGLSPPPKVEGEVDMQLLQHAECPKCGSTRTRLLNTFGPTACRAIHHCDDCHETFEQMKPL